MSETQSLTRPEMKGILRLWKPILGFDLLLLIDAMILLALLLALYWGTTSKYCGYLAVYGRWFMASAVLIAYLGLQAPIVAIAGTVLVGARKSRLSGRFCAALAVLLGLAMLVYPTTKIEGNLEEMRCFVVDENLPWSVTLGSLWVGIGLILLPLGRLPFIGHRPLPVWTTRPAGVVMLLALAATTLPASDAYTYPLPSALVTWEGDALYALGHWPNPLNMVAVDSSLIAALLSLTLVGIRQGSIGLTGLRAAFLLLGAAHFAVMLVNLGRLAVNGLLSAFFVDQRGLAPLGLVFIWSSLWLGLGIAFCLIRRDWWERAPVPHPPR